MAILGDPGADEMGVPSRSCNPRERNWEPLPIPPNETTPAPRPPGLAPPLPRSLRVPSRSGDPREHMPGESQGRQSLVGCRLWGRTESDMTEVT